MYFDGLMAGDSVWAIDGGQFIVSKVTVDDFSLENDSIGEDESWFSLDGELLGFEELGQILFWQKPDFTPPPRPKKRVVKEGWVHPWDIHGIARHVAECANNEVRCIKVTYEVEE